MGAYLDLADAVGGFLRASIQAVHGADHLLDSHGLLFHVEGNLLAVEHYVINGIGHTGKGVRGFLGNFDPFFYGLGAFVGTMTVELRVAVWMSATRALIFSADLRLLIRQLANFTGDHRKALAMFPSSYSLYSSVEGQHIGLVGQVAYQGRKCRRSGWFAHSGAESGRR